MTIEDLKGDDPTLVAIALQALHRERAAAYHAACTACDLAGKRPPGYDLLGLDKVDNVLRRIGAASIQRRLMIMSAAQSGKMGEVWGGVQGGRRPMPAQIKVALLNFWMLRLRAA